MSTRPKAALALWNDVDVARDGEYNHWHAVEHVPERVWAPGFLAATRYRRSTGDGPRYFTLYEMRTIDALGSPQYRELVQRPTPWSATMRPSMSAFIRKPLSLSLLTDDAAPGVGGGVVTVRAVWDTVPTGWSQQLAMAAALVRAVAPDVMRIGAGWVADAGPQAIPNEQDAPPGVEAIAWAELEADADERRLAARCDLLVRQLDAVLPLPTWRMCAGYELLTRVSRQLPDGAPRPLARLDLMHKYKDETRW